jgi:hypothetical protein
LHQVGPLAADGLYLVTLARLLHPPQLNTWWLLVVVEVVVLVVAALVER